MPEHNDAPEPQVTFSGAAVEAVRDILEQNADRGGLVNMSVVWRDFLKLPLDAVAIQDAAYTPSGPAKLSR